MAKQMYDYKGYQIDPIPRKVDESNEWEVQLHIFSPGTREIRIKYIDTGIRCQSKEEAENACIILGQQIIDGKHPKYKIDDL